MSPWRCMSALQQGQKRLSSIRYFSHVSPSLFSRAPTRDHHLRTLTMVAWRSARTILLLILVVATAIPSARTLDIFDKEADLPAANEPHSSLRDSASNDQQSQLAVTKTAKFVAKPVVHAAKATATAAMGVKHKAEHKINEMKWHQAERQKDIARAHSSVDGTRMIPPHLPCNGPIQTLADATQIITDTKPLDVCEHLFSESADLRAQAHIGGSEWHNWGLTYAERATRFLKYAAISIQPKRVLRREVDVSRQFVKAEPHGMILSSNGDLHLIRIRDGKVIDTITRQQ
eukprot:942-Heterococcus_DN1.PRE.1